MDAWLNMLMPQLRRLLARQDRVILAIDGNCGAGKTTLAAALAERMECNVFHMDDFFLRPEQRTPQRLAEVGGNVDYERFRQEVLLPLERGEPFSYRPFFCGTRQLREAVPVEPKALSIVEGTYSTHPYFGNLYDWKVFLSIDPELQRSRICQRPPHLHQRFFGEWIPMEGRYFETFSIPAHCDQIFRSTP